MPRLKNIGGQKLYRPKTGESDPYSNLQLVLTRPINSQLIAQNYDLMIEFATVMHLGPAETEAILRRFTCLGPQRPAYLTFLELERAVKTIFLCRYLESEELRREVHAGLNVIENWNGANDFIFMASKGVCHRSPRSVGVEHVISAFIAKLSGLCECLADSMCLGRTRAVPTHVERRLAGLTPLIYSHVTSYGMFRLGLSEPIEIEESLSA